MTAARLAARPSRPLAWPGPNNTRPPTGPDQARPRPRPPITSAAGNGIATMALTVLTLAAVFSLSRLYLGRSYVGPVLVVAIGVHASAWLGRMLKWPPWIAALASLASLVVLASWTVLPGSTTAGLPTMSTLHAAARALHQASVGFHLVTAPTAVTEGFLLVTVGAIGLLSILADWAAFRMRATLEATVPSFAVFIFCAALGSHRSRNLAVIVEVAGLLAFVVIHQATVDHENAAWFANRTDGALTSLASAGAVIGLAVLIIALNLGFRLPQANAKGLVAWRASDRIGRGTRNTLSPLVELQGRILNHSTDPVFKVRSNVATYWRLTSLDSFNGTDWNALSTYHPVGHHLSGGDTATTKGQTVEQDFTIENLDEPWLPAAYEPFAITGAKGVTYDSQSGSLIFDKPTTTGLAYHVSSVVNVGELSPTTLTSAPPAPTRGSMAQELKLPVLPPDVVNLARSIVAGQATEYDKAVAIQDYLRSPRFSYNDKYSYQGPDPLEHFLFDANGRQGYCQQFAGSYAVLARLAGLPTRLAVGWTQGNQSEPGVYQVLDNQAHTWPEVYFAGVGWVSFEPTPGRGMPGAQSYTRVAPAQAGGQAATPAPAATVPASGGASSTVPTRPDRTQQDGRAAGVKKHHHSRWSADAVLVGIAIGLLVVLAGVAFGIALVVRRIRRTLERESAVGQAVDLEDVGSAGKGRNWDRFAGFREAWAAEGLTASAAFVRRLAAIVRLEWLLPLLPGRAPGPRVGDAVIARAEVLLTWAEVVDLLAWWDLRRRPSETYHEFAHRAAIELRAPLAVVPPAVAALLDLAEAGTRGEFGCGTMSTYEVERAAQNLVLVRRALVGSASNAQRLRLAVDPRLTAKVR